MTCLWGGEMSESWTVTGPQVIEVDGVTSLRVGLVGGRVDVVARDEPGARIEVHDVSGRPLEVALEGGELRVGYAFTLDGWDQFVERFRAFSSRDRADVHVAVPRAVAARVGTVSAEGLVAGLVGDSAVSTVSGPVMTDGTRGSLSVNTVSGEVVVSAHDGDLRLKAVSGDVTATGDLSDVHATTVSGSVLLDLRVPAAAVGVTSVSGEVTTRVPAGTGARVDVRTVSGRVLVGASEHRPRNPGSSVTAELPGERPAAVSATTVSGDVVVIGEEA